MDDIAVYENYYCLFLERQLNSPPHDGMEAKRARAHSQALAELAGARARHTQVQQSQVEGQVNRPPTGVKKTRRKG